MQVRKFRADNLQMALEEIRRTMGSDASVLQTRQIRDGWMGWLGRTYVEVTAGISEDGDEDFTIELKQDQTYRNTDVRSTGLERLATLDHPSTETQFPAALGLFREALHSQGVPMSCIERWLLATQKSATSRGPLSEHQWLEELQAAVASEIRIAGPIRTHSNHRQVVALVGPTGVGKTTTLAKLAAGFRLESKQRVGLITIDTYRIAAVEQLRSYAQIMDLPMQVVEAPNEMQSALDRLGDVDLVLIDTAGRSPRSEVSIEQLMDLLHEAKPDETHLVLSATSSAFVIQSALDGFALARPTGAILTKLDESPLIAGALSAITRTDSFPGLPVSYLTNGQQVPDDIVVADANQLVSRLLSPPAPQPKVDAA